MQPLLQWRSKMCYIFWACFCSRTHPVCKAHTSYYIAIRGLSGSTIFYHTIP